MLSLRCIASQTSRRAVQLHMMSHGQCKAAIVSTALYDRSRSYATGNGKTVQERIDEYATYRQTSVSIKQFTDFGKDRSLQSGLNSCKFLRSELPIRLAHMIKEIDDIPAPLLNSAPVQMVRGWYVESFTDILGLPNSTEIDDNSADEYVKAFTQTISKILKRHAPVVVSIAQGILELKRTHGENFMGRPIQYFLDRIYMSRIGIRMLIGQHCELFGNKNSPKTMIGVIDEKCDVPAVILDAIDNARFLCEQYYFASPEVTVVMPHQTEEAFRFPYIPSHLYHMVFELLKNSMRAVVEQYGDDDNIPPIKIVLVKGNEDLTIKIADEGGGIPRSDMPHVFTYLYTTAKLPDSLSEDAYNTDINHAPLAGFGYGLPLSRLYARYLGGDLQIISVDGYGTDAYIYLRQSADAANEVLPTYSSTAMQHYNSSTQVNDWLLNIHANRSERKI
eukprot:CFRG0090T1